MDVIIKENQSKELEEKLSVYRRVTVETGFTNLYDTQIEVTVS